MAEPAVGRSINKVAANGFMPGALMLGLFNSLHATSSLASDLPPIKWGAFVDTYYAYDFNNPPDHERAFVTQAKRSNEFNVNLAYLDAQVSTDRYRGRVAFQAGTSVQANYANEPTLGATSGPSLSRDIQEAFAGYHVTDKLWVDAGISFSYIGFENWISWNNWTYTRSLDAEFTPYYQAGVRATYQLTDQLSAQFNVTNGWQIISENNGNKAVGIQIVYTPNSIYSLTYNNFFGQETTSSGFMSERYFNQIYGQVHVTDALQMEATYDIGFQKIITNGGVAHWWDVTLLARYQVTPILAFAGRGEYYSDPDQVIVNTQTPNGFQTWGASMNCDIKPSQYFIWRSEFRWLQSEDSVFPGSSGRHKSDPLAVTSLALKI